MDNRGALKASLIRFMWGRSTVGERVSLATIKFYLMVQLRTFLNSLGVGLGERTVEYRWIIKNIGKKKGEKLLDLGCGNKRIDCVFYLLGYRVYAVDINLPKQRYCGIQYKQVDVTHGTGFNNNFFDVIVAISTLEHIGLGAYGDPIVQDGDLIAMDEIRRILKKSGIALITGPFSHKPLMTWFRYYDTDRVEATKKGFLVLDEQYYISSRKWLRCDKLMAIKYVEKHGPFNPVGGPNTLFCLKLQKL